MSSGFSRRGAARGRALWVGILVIVLGGGYFLYARGKADSANKETQYILAVAAKGTVRRSVSATGTLQAWKVVDIKSKAGGKVVEMGVDLGSTVAAGQVIAKIDPADSLVNVQTAQADINGAIARMKQNTVSYDLQVKNSETSIATAQAQLQSALANVEAATSRYKTATDLAGIQPTLTSASIKQAEANYENVLKQKDQLRSTQSLDRASAKASFDQAEANFKNAEANAKRQQKLLSQGFVSQQTADAAIAAQEVAKATLASAREHLRTIGDTQKAEASAMDARVEQAAAQLATAKAQPDIQNKISAAEEAKAALQQAKAQALQAQVSLRQALAGRKTNDVRRYDIETAQATIARSRATLTNAEVTLQQTVVRAPVEGVVLQKYVEQGTIITSGLSLSSTGTSIVQIGDVSRMYVNVTVDETDIANIEEEQQVEVTIDAYPGMPFEGKVIRIDPQATVVQNVTTIAVRVEIDNSAASFRLLKPGMNATCEFVVDQKEDVLTVPTDAIRSDDAGSYVEIATGGKPAPESPDTTPGALIGVQKKRQTVEVGIQGNEAVEVISGLQEGAKIISQTIEPVTATPAGGGSPFGTGRGMGGMGGGRSR